MRNWWLMLVLIVGLAVPYAVAQPISTEAQPAWAQEFSHGLCDGTELLVQRGAGEALQALLTARFVMSADVHTVHRPTISSRGDAGDGFLYQNVRFEPRTAIGEMTNTGHRTYEMVTFTLSVYNTWGALVEVCPIVLSGFRAGTTRSWIALCGDIPEVMSYKIDLDVAL